MDLVLIINIPKLVNMYTLTPIPYGDEKTSWIRSLVIRVKKICSDNYINSTH